MLLPDVPLALTFDDVLLVPRASEVLPRNVALDTLLGRLSLGIPILSSAMDTVTEAETAMVMARQGGLGVIHKNQTVRSQADQVRRVKEAVSSDGTSALLCGAAVGVGPQSMQRVHALVEAEVDLLVVDTAHGHSAGVLEAAQEVKNRYPHVTLVVGNVATPEATVACIEAGADVVKVGVGPGSICTTRIIAGVGVPQLTAVSACAAAAHERGATIIADGGIRHSGDIAKAIAAGADAVMLGSLLAGTDESPGDELIEGGIRYKIYRGMGSIEAMRAGSSDRYFQDDGANPAMSSRKLVPEGIVGRVPCRGPLVDVIYQLLGGLRSSMGYCGCPSLGDMQRDARFVRITQAGVIESHVHDVVIDRAAPNYTGR